MTDYIKRTWAVINLDNLSHNITQIKRKLPETIKIMAVVKADGYGHGDKYIANALVECGIDFFAVSNLGEALSLRNAGIECDILILGFTPAIHAPKLAKLNISQSIFSKEYADELNHQCEKSGCKVKIHIKLDTGMGRIGFLENSSHSAHDKVIEVCNMKGLDVTGIFSHLSSADALDLSSIEYTHMQTEFFDNAIERLKKEGYIFKHIHLQNSAGISFVEQPSLSYTHARAGIVMYGCAPSSEQIELDIRPVMELKSVISMVKEVDAGTSISYSRKYVSNTKIKVATVPIGYADGYPRLLSNKGEMLVKSKRARIIGNVCMDQLMLDVSHIENVKHGDIVTVVGTDGNETIGFNELSNIIGTISYELMCLIGRRVPRVYIKNGKETAVVDYILQL